MTITTVDGVTAALASNHTRVLIDKASASNRVAGEITSLWRSTGFPAQGAIPGTTPTVPDNTTLGAINFTQQTNPATSYLALMALASSTGNATVYFVDRLAHMGGLLMNITTSQVVTGMDLSTIGLSAARRGAADYSHVEWWLEYYADAGSTASSATINVTFHDGTTGNLTAVAVGSTLRAQRALPLNSLIASADNGKKIRGINSVILSASTGSAGNFGFTATRNLTILVSEIANRATVAPFDVLGMPELPNGTCLTTMLLCNTTVTGTLRGNGKIIHG